MDNNLNLFETIELSNYIYHRKKYPDTPAQEWSLIFDEWEHYERLYQERNSKTKENLNTK